MEDDEIPFALLTNFVGYRTKEDETTIDEHYLVSGSRNVLINTAKDKVISRQGYSLFGAEDTSGDRIGMDSEHVWTTSTGSQIMLRKNGTDLEYYSTQSSAFETLTESLNTDYPARFAEIWNVSELIDELLIVNHSADMLEWSGAVGTLAVGGVAAGTITINEQIGSARFLTTGTRSIRIKDDNGVWRETAYTNQAGAIFTVSSDLTGFPFSGNNLVVQSLRTNANLIGSTYIVDTIKSLDNQVYVGSATSRVHYISKDTSFIDFTYSSPRIPGEGAKLTLDDVNVGYEVGKNENGVEVMIVFCGQSFVYRTEFVLSAGSASDREVVKVQPLIAAARQGARTQELICKTKNDIIFVNHDNELVEVGQLENYATREALPISDAIKPDFDAADFTGGGHVAFSKTQILVSSKADGVVFIFDTQNKYWQPPQDLPTALFSNYGDDLYGHAGSLKETYLLFDGLSDRSTTDGSGVAYISTARWAYRNHGQRARLKNFDRYYHELYLTPSMTGDYAVTHNVRYDYGGSKGIQTAELDASETKYLFTPTANASLGVHSLGTVPLARPLEEPLDFSKYRRFKTHQSVDYFEMQSEYTADILDSQFQVVAHGPNAQESANEPAKISS